VSGIPSDQVLAILRLRQWAVERNALKCGRTARLTNAGWRERRETDADARNVRVIDFEKALATLDTAHQYALILTYRDRAGHAATAAAIGCSVRTLAYMLPAARRRLADVLDRLDLL
jgi:DNA-directed RNA polymerase specialized sigma24 family protein